MLRTLVLGLGLVAAIASDARALRCGDVAGDAAAIAAARAVVDGQCDCAGAATHGLYVRCARDVAVQRASSGELRPECVRAVARCASKSVCGRPGRVACCITRNGKTKCRTNRTAAVCTARGGCVSVFPSCCDACSISGCATPTTTTTLVTTTNPVSTTETTSSTSSSSSTGTSTTIPDATTTTTIPVPCGDGRCDPGEDCSTCCADCGVCVPSCGNGRCDAGEASQTCPGDCVAAEVPTLPLALLDCAFETYRQTLDCSTLPTLTIHADPIDSGCFSSLESAPVSTSAAARYLPASCCASTSCGGGEAASTLHTGDVINVVNGTVSSLFAILADCVGQGIREFTVPLIPCGSTCTSANAVTGFARVILNEVVATGADKHITLSAICHDVCGDLQCSASESCTTCAADCGGCAPTCP